MRERYYDPDRPLNYSYKSENKSLLDNYVLNHFWPYAIKVIPPTASANLVSILGSLSCWACFLLLAGVFTGPFSVAARRQPWLFGVAALLLFIYQTLDSLDGIQARRTGASGPLGEFIDHWFDSINAYLVPLGIALAFPVVPPAVAAITMILVASAGWLSAKAMRDSGIMRFGPVSGEEVLSITYLFFLAFWALGYDFWSRPGPWGVAPIAVVYLLVPVLLAGSSIASFASVKDGLGRYALAMLCLLPALGWTLAYLRSHGSSALALGGLLICCIGARYAGDMLRDRLVGLEYQTILPDILVVDLALVVSALMATRHPGPSLLIAVACFVWLAGSLAQQFGRTVARVREVTGRSIFGIAPERAGAPKAVPAGLRRGVFQRQARPAPQRWSFPRRER